MAISVRRVMRIGAAVALALLLLAAGLLGLYLQSSDFQERMRAAIVSAIEQKFPVSVELKSAQLRLFGLRLRLRGLKILSREFPAPDPAVEADQVEVNLTLTSFWRPAVSLDAVDLEGLRVRIVKDSNGRLNLWNMFRKEELAPPKLTAFIRLAIGNVTLHDGLIVFENLPFRLESERGGMEIEMRFAGPRSYEGTLRLSRTDLKVGSFALDQLDSQVEFALFENSIELPSMRIRSQQAEGTASGVIDDLGELVYRFETDLQVHPARIQSLGFDRWVSEGQVGLRGVFTGRKASYGFVGQADAPQLTVRDLRFDDISARVRVDSKSMAVDEATARFQGGSVEARGELGWNEETLSEFQLAGRGLRLEQLLRPLRLDPLRVRGSSNASARVQWPGTRWESIQGSGSGAYRGDFLFAANPPAAEPVSFPLSGTVSFSLVPGGVRLADGRADCLDGLLLYQGSVGFEGSYDVQLDFEAEQGEVLQRAGRESGFLSADFLESLHLALPGAARLKAGLTGAGREFRLAGNASFGELLLLGSSATLEADFELTPQQLSASKAKLRSGAQSLDASLRYVLSPADEARFLQLDLTAQAVNLAWFSRLSGWDKPLQGTASGSLQLEEFLPGQYRGSGDFSLAGADWKGWRLDSADGRLRLDGARLWLEDLRGGTSGGTLRGRLFVDLNERNLDGEAAGADIPLEKIPALAEWVARVEAAGSADFDVKASGSLDSPRFQATVRADALRLAGQQLGRVRLEASNRQGPFDRAEFSVEAVFEGNRLAAAGQLALRQPYEIEADMNLTDFPLAPYLKLLPLQTDIEIEGQATGSVSLSGALADPESLDIAASFSRLRLTMAGYEVENRNNVTLVLKAGTLRVLPTTLVGKETELNLAGTVELTGARSLDLKTSGVANLLLLNTFMGGATFGQLQLETVLSGTLDEPRLVGQAQLSQGFLRHPDVPTTFFDAEAKFRFTVDQVAVDQFSARTPYGRINAEGGVFLDGLRPARWLVNLYGTGLRIEYPQQVFSTLDVDLDFINNGDTRLLSGAVYVRSSEYREQITLPELILRYSTGRAALGTPATAGQLDLDIDVEGYRTLQITNNLAEVTASGDFKIRGTAQNPVILGSLTVDEGKLFLEGNEYEVIRGSVTFNDPRATRPVLSFEAETEVRDFSVTVLLQGPLDQLNASFRSDPPLASSSIVSLLAVGQTQEEIFGVEGRGQDQAGSLAIYGAGALLSKSLGKKLEEQTTRLFGFEKLSIDPFLYGSERDPGARVTLGKRLGRRLSVTYSTDLGNEGQGQIVVIEWKLTDWLTAVGTGEQNGILAIDFKLRKRF